MVLNHLRSLLAGFKRTQYHIIPNLDLNLNSIFTSRSNGSSSITPITILIQIIILQIFYYITATILSYSLALLIGQNFSLEWVFSWHIVSLENTLGWTIIGLWFLDSFICVLFMTIIVGRSKLAWDFAITIHFINLLVVWIYSGQFPKNIVWWAVQLGSCVLLVSLGTWTSRWRELRDTFFEGIVDTELGGVGRNGIEMHDISNE